MSELVASAWQLANPPGKAGHTYLYMVRHFFMVVYRTWYGKIMLSIWSGYCAGPPGAVK